VVPSEIPANWEDEALKAQVVASRTYAYYHIMAARKHSSAYDLDSSVLSQVYRGIDDEKTSTSRAVRATSGEILLHEYLPILSYFHSTCGGKTVSDSLVWKKSSMPYLKGVRCGYCSDSTRYSWETKLSLGQIRNCLSVKYGVIGEIRSLSFKKKDDRVTDVIIRHAGGIITLGGNDFRLLFPGDTIQSLYFTSTQVSTGLILKGFGWGHGVGMCQWGARGMARKGFRYRQILRHYYAGVHVGSVGHTNIAATLKEREPNR
ncbi:MAG: SpoIID/LytB domain-containing protein, partial [Chrysiogenales bacterium]